MKGSLRGHSLGVAAPFPGYLRNGLGRRPLVCPPAGPVYLPGVAYFNAFRGWLCLKGYVCTVPNLSEADCFL
jgi:hypothetical protein